MLYLLYESGINGLKRNRGTEHGLPCKTEMTISTLSTKTSKCQWRKGRRGPLCLSSNMSQNHFKLTNQFFLSVDFFLLKSQFISLLLSPSILGRPTNSWKHFFCSPLLSFGAVRNKTQRDAETFTFTLQDNMLRVGRILNSTTGF